MNKEKERKITKYTYSALSRLAFPDDCRKIRERYRIKNPENVKASATKYREGNLEKLRKRDREAKRNLRIEHPLKWLKEKERKKKYNANYHMKNRESLRNNCKEYYRKNSNSIKNRSKSNRDANKEELESKRLQKVYGPFWEIAKKNIELQKEILCQEKQQQEKH